jgi:hypothetical protein
MYVYLYHSVPQHLVKFGQVRNFEILIKQRGSSGHWFLLQTQAIIHAYIYCLGLLDVKQFVYSLHGQVLQPVLVAKSKRSKAHSQFIAKPATNPCFYFSSTFNLLRAT